MFKFKVIHTLNDAKVNCFSILTEIESGQYYQFVKKIYKNAGGIENQRPPLTTKSAKIIRARMVRDLKDGSVIPPIVLGAVVDTQKYDAIFVFFKNGDSAGIETIMSEIVNKPSHISIIDGMQRTTAISEILESNDLLDPFSTNKIRIEFWLATYVRSLIYRMLVLNTGQIPWRLDRQIKVLYADVEKEIKEVLKDTIDLHSDNTTSARTKAGQYPSADILTLFIVFGSKNLHTDTTEEIAEEFKRLEFVNSVKEKDFTHIFIEILHFMIVLDEQFSRIKADAYGEIQLKRIKSGFELFSAQPARAGFMFAFTEYIMGLNGAEHHRQQAADALAKCKTMLNKLITRMKQMSDDDLAQFVDLAQLSEVIVQRSSKVGRFERDLFYRAFKKMLEVEARLPFTPYWKAN